MKSGTLPRLAAAMLIAATTIHAQDAGQVREMFEAGRYEQVIEAAGPDAEPVVVYTAVLSHQKLGRADQASALAERLARLPGDSAWHYVGMSAGQFSADQTDAALESAQSAVKIDDALPQAHHQLGLVLARRQAWREAAAAFDKASQLDPQSAYAHYYGGLMHYRANRPDLMAVRFERFLKLAPEAPERPEVLQIMRTIRGR